MEVKCWQLKAHNTFWEEGGCLTPFLCYSVTKIGLQAKMARGSEIRKKPQNACWCGWRVWFVYFLSTKDLFSNLYQSTDSKALHDAGIRPNPGEKKKKRVRWWKRFSRVPLSKEIKKQSCRNFKLPLKNNISNPIQLHLPHVLREEIKWKK